MNTSTMWFLVGLGFVALECVTSGLFVLWFGVAAFAVGALTLVLPLGLTTQLVLFTAASLALVVASRPLAERFLLRGSPGAKIQMGVSALQGANAVVLEPIDNVMGTGRVKVQGQTWAALSTADEVPIEAGTRVEVIEVRGVKLVVREQYG